MTVENIEFLIFLAGSRCTVCYSFIHRNYKSLSRGSQPNLGHGLSSLSPFFRQLLSKFCVQRAIELFSGNFEGRKNV